MSCVTSKNLAIIRLYGDTLLIKDKINTLSNLYYVQETKNLFTATWDCNGVEVCIKIVNIFVPIKRKCAHGSPLAFIRKELKISTRSSLINNFSIKWT